MKLNKKSVHTKIYKYNIKVVQKRIGGMAGHITRNPNPEPEKPEPEPEKPEPEKPEYYFR